VIEPPHARETQREGIEERTMNRLQKKARIEEIFDHFNRRDLDRIDGILHPDYVGHLRWGDIRGIPALKEFVQTCWLNPFPDAWFEVSNIVVDGDLAAWQVRFTGTNTVGIAPACLTGLPSAHAALLQWSLMGMPPTGATVDVVNLHIGRLGERDRLIEHWTANDHLAILPHAAGRTIGMRAVS
jgi:predicted ester cyclase